MSEEEQPKKSRGLKLEEVRAELREICKKNNEYRLRRQQSIAGAINIQRARACIEYHEQGLRAACERLKRYELFQTSLEDRARDTYDLTRNAIDDLKAQKLASAAAKEELGKALLDKCAVWELNALSPYRWNSEKREWELVDRWGFHEGMPVEKIPPKKEEG